MARAIHKLKFRQGETLRKVGRHSDVLYLKITSHGSMYARGGQQRPGRRLQTALRKITDWIGTLSPLALNGW